jgi:site-specific recombinase XerD
MPANLTFKKVQLKAKHQYTATLGGRADTAFDPHTMRHACGFKLAAAGVDTRALQAYQGHRNIQHTVHYTELSPTRFKDFWRS